MTLDPYTVTEDVPIETIVQLMEQKHIKRLPVVRGAELVGIISRADRGHSPAACERVCSMRAMILDAAHRPLRLDNARPMPQPASREVLVHVRACGVCRTDLHVVDGELTRPKLPLVPGHEIVGTVADIGSDVRQIRVGERVGVPWLGWTCGQCVYCQTGRENLCERARFTGYQIDGGYAEYTLADERFCFPIPASFTDVEAAPLLCAGLIGYRALRLAGEVERLGLYGFGAAAHIAAQVARYRGQKVFAFTKPGDRAGQDFARGLGVFWAGGSDVVPPEPLDAALIFAPVGELVPVALAATGKGGTVVCAGIHMSDIPSFPYRILWEERVLRSVANLTRRDGDEFLAIATKVPVRTTTVPFPLADANEALIRLRDGRIEGAAVLVT
jgi:alcohol dehydrogenase, propanol-preferring